MTKSEIFRQKTIFLRGFSMRWEVRPHRIKRLQFGTSLTTLPQKISQAKVVAESQGGNWANGQYGKDFPHMGIQYTALEGNVLVGFRTLSLTLFGQNDKRTTQNGVLCFEFANSIPARTPTVALLGGFCIDTENSHPHGFTIRGLSLSLGTPVLEGRQVRVPVQAQIAAGAVPDRYQRLLQYEVAIKIAVRLLVLPKGKIEKTSVEAIKKFPQNKIKTPQALFSYRPPETLAFGLSSFSFTIPRYHPLKNSGFSSFLQKRLSFNGRYLRSFHLFLGKPKAVDEKKLGVPVSFLLSNKGSVPRPFWYYTHAEIYALSSPNMRVLQGRWSNKVRKNSHQDSFSLPIEP